MTVGGDFIPTGDMAGAGEPKYPVVFGITLTPTVSGILLALTGLGVAAYLFTSFVQPALQENQTLQADIDAKEQQLQDQAEVERQIAEAEQQLADAKKLQADVLALFATEDSLNTLLLDVNERVQAANARIADPEKQARLLRFTPIAPATPSPDGQPGDLVTDTSYGAAVQNKLRQVTYDVQIEGSFVQIQSIIRNIERLQPLLVVRELVLERAETQPLLVTPRGAQIVLVQPDPRLKVSFKLIALLPAPSVPAPAPAPAAPAEGTPTPSPSP